MTLMFDFTIVCLCHNQRAFVEKALESVCAQKQVIIQLLIVDDGSSDGSKELIQQWIDKNKAALPENIKELKFFNLEWQGNCKAFSTALLFAKGTYLIDLAADDCLAPNTLFSRKLFADDLQAMAKLPLGLVYSNALYVEANGNSVATAYPTEEFTLPCIWPNYTPSGVLPWELVQRFFIAPPTALFSTKALQAVGGYSEFLAYEDFDVYLKLANANFSIIYQPELTMLVHTNLLGSHGNRRSRRRWAYFSSTLFVLSRQVVYATRPKHYYYLWQRLFREIYYYLQLFIVSR